MKLSVNSQDLNISDDYSDDLLLWALRDGAGLTGTHFGCGIGECGSCTVLVDGAPTRSCQIPASEVGNQTVTTMEGLANGSDLHAVQQAFVEFPLQCQWCLPGHLMTAVALLAQNPQPTAAEIEEVIARNLCRCGGYNQIRKAISRASELSRGSQ